MPASCVMQGSNSSISNEKKKRLNCFFPNEKSMLSIPKKKWLVRSCETALKKCQFI